MHLLVTTIKMKRRLFTSRPSKESCFFGAVPEISTYCWYYFMGWLQCTGPEFAGRRGNTSVSRGPAGTGGWVLMSLTAFYEDIKTASPVFHELKGK